MKQHVLLLLAMALFVYLFFSSYPKRLQGSRRVGGNQIFKALQSGASLQGMAHTDTPVQILRHYQ